MEGVEGGAEGGVEGEMGGVEGGVEGEMGGGAEGGGRGGGAEGGGDMYDLGPQSAQSSPYGQTEFSAPGPPSSHSPSERSLLCAAQPMM